MINSSSGIHKDTLRGRTIQRVNIPIMIKMATPSAAPILPAFSALQAKLVLKRNGRTHVIFQDSLDILCRESMYNHSYDQMTIAANGQNIGTDLWLYNLYIDLIDVINLQGDDVAEFELTALQGWAPAGVDANNSTIDPLWGEAIGVETEIPMIKSISIKPGDSKFDESLGDNVHSVFFCHTGANGNALAGAPWSQIAINSDKYMWSGNIQHLWGRRNTRFEDLASCYNRGANFLFEHNVELDKVNVQGILQPSVVTAGSCAIVYRSYVIDPGTAARAVHLVNKHTRKAQHKMLKAGVPAATVNAAA